MKRGLDPNVCLGILSGPNEYSVAYLLKEAQSASYFWSYGIALLLGLIPFVLFVKYSTEKIKLGIKKFLLVFLFLFLFSAPLFLLAFDWGRWINIHFMMLLFTSTLLLKDKLPETASEWKNKKLVLPRLWKSETPLLKLFSNVFFLVICFSYLFFWQLKHFGSFSVFSPNKYELFQGEINRSINTASELISRIPE